jgi:MIP family channel proteins
VTERPILAHECLAEALGTFLLVFFGTGTVFVAALTGSLQGLFQVAIVWGFAIALIIYALGAISGAHINPAITLAMSLFRGFPPRKVLPYVLAQLAGAFAASAVLFFLFSGVLAGFEQEKGLTRGQAGSERSAMVFGEYFPNPAIFGTTREAYGKVSEAQAMAAEALGTALLAFFVFAVTERRNRSRPNGTLFALFIGLAVAILICVLAPLTQGGFNPARDFGPRLFAYLAGWGAVAIPGPRGGFFSVYVLGPFLGAIAGAAAYQGLVRPRLATSATAESSLVNCEPSGERAMPQPRVVLVGGFLGAGKTTLVKALARRFTQGGQRVAVVTNDQAANLVDTGLLQTEIGDVGEVAGACFCCSFDSFVGELRRLGERRHPETIIAEPVGSCTDLSATVLQPLKGLYAQAFRVAPFSVLVDPLRLRESLAPQAQRSFPESVLYIYRLQIEEADVIVLNKSDLLSQAEVSELTAELGRRYPGRPVFAISALTGQGIDVWLDFVLGESLAGQRITEVDYDVYAEGEALLGWLNATVGLETSQPSDWSEFCRSLLEELRGRLGSGSEIAHAKLLLTASGGWVAANVTSGRAEVSVRGRLTAPSRQASLTVNARAHVSPEVLREAVLASLRAASGSRVREQVREMRSLSPGRPRPTHRFKQVVASC